MYKLLREILKELKEANETLKIIAFPSYHKQPQWLHERKKEVEEARQKYPRFKDAVGAARKESQTKNHTK